MPTITMKQDNLNERNLEFTQAPLRTPVFLNSVPKSGTHLIRNIMRMFVPVEQQFPVVYRLMVEPVGHLIYGDVHSRDIHLAVFDAGIGLLDARLFLAERLHLASLQDNTGLKGLDYLVIEPGLLVPRYFDK